MKNFMIVIIFLALLANLGFYSCQSPVKPAQPSQEKVSLPAAIASEEPIQVEKEKTPDSTSKETIGPYPEEKKEPLIISPPEPSPPPEVKEELPVVSLPQQTPSPEEKEGLKAGIPPTLPDPCEAALKALISPSCSSL